MRCCRKKLDRGFAGSSSTYEVVPVSPRERRHGSVQVFFGPSFRQQNRRIRTATTTNAKTDPTQTRISGKLMKKAMTESAQSASPEIISLSAILA